MDLAARRERRVILSVPPRHGKSELCSKYTPAWWLGTFPDQKVLLASYEASFAATWGGKARDLMEEFGPELWNVKVSGDSSARDAWKLEGFEGEMVTAGAGGALMGRGAHLIIVDDPIKNHEVAASPTYQESMLEWWDSTLSSRTEPGAVILLVMTRWGENDIAGKLLARMAEGGETWKEIRLPALAEEGDPLGRAVGEALWPERFDREWMESRRANMIPYWWASLYQQRPAPMEGGQFKRSWFRSFRTIHEEGTYELLGEGKALKKIVKQDDCWRFATMDLATSLKERADYTCLAVWAVTPDKDLLLLDVIRERVEGPDHIKLARRVMGRWRPAYIGIEKAGFQLAAIQAARKDGLPVRELKADRDKLARSLTISAFYEGGRVYHPLRADWLPAWESELLTFPNSEHDDQVDVASYAGQLVARRPTFLLDQVKDRLVLRHQREEKARADAAAAWY